MQPNSLEAGPSPHAENDNFDENDNYSYSELLIHWLSIFQLNCISFLPTSFFYLEYQQTVTYDSSSMYLSVKHFMW